MPSTFDREAYSKAHSKLVKAVTQKRDLSIVAIYFDSRATCFGLWEERPLRPGWQSPESARFMGDDANWGPRDGRPEPDSPGLFVIDGDVDAVLPFTPADRHWFNVPLGPYLSKWDAVDADGTVFLVKQVAMRALALAREQPSDKERVLGIVLYDAPRAAAAALRALRIGGVAIEVDDASERLDRAAASELLDPERLARWRDRLAGDPQWARPREAKDTVDLARLRTLATYFAAGYDAAPSFAPPVLQRFTHPAYAAYILYATYWRHVELGFKDDERAGK